MKAGQGEMFLASNYYDGPYPLLVLGKYRRKDDGSVWTCVAANSRLPGMLGFVNGEWLGRAAKQSVHEYAIRDAAMLFDPPVRTP